MKERSEMIAWMRGDLVGPSIPLAEPDVAEFSDYEFNDPIASRDGALGWKPTTESAIEEVLYFENESPHRKYGSGRLHPATNAEKPDESALRSTDTVGFEADIKESLDEGDENEGLLNENAEVERADESDDFEVTSGDIRHPSTMGISFCVHLENDSEVLINLPCNREFVWQAQEMSSFPLNGRYEQCSRNWTDKYGHRKQSTIWRRLPAMLPDTAIAINRSKLVHGEVIKRWVPMAEGSPLNLRLDIFPRKLNGQDNVWLLTVVLRNLSSVETTREMHEATLYQTYFEVSVVGGSLHRYPESPRPFNQLDPEEQSLELLYRESATWGVGHGCAAAWDANPGEEPSSIYADVMPAVQLPSMTPDIEVDGLPLTLSMRELSTLSSDGTGTPWQALETLVSGYESWILRESEKVDNLPKNLAHVATRHLEACSDCLNRIKAGVERLRNDERTLEAFRLANLAMLLQQISTKQIERRGLGWNMHRKVIEVQGNRNSPWQIYETNQEDTNRVGLWRAFQVAFLLMSLEGVRDAKLPDREIVDLVWFPTGGGKTEAYLAVMAFYMFHERLLMPDETSGLRRDGTNILMRYTLRMLTTQQFQRAASLICAMEYLRQNDELHQIASVPGGKFSLGLWVGSDGSPNNVKQARGELASFRRGDVTGNPLVITECPWCRAQIGRYEGSKPNVKPRISDADWQKLRTRGIKDDPEEGPLLQCPDPSCEFGQEFTQLPVEVIDERIYQDCPSLVIATADKFAMIAYRPIAGKLFGRQVDGDLQQEAFPPGLIIQDELHLISGPLGTMYALYESIIERLCTSNINGKWIKPKIIASTATIRGAEQQVRALYARPDTRFFPSPGLSMGDSFFGKYARDDTGELMDGRLYLGIHAADYGSILTAQVRAFSSALFRAWPLEEDKRDPWWTLLAFYNSIRELSGAKTLFDSDIRSRLKLLFNREGYKSGERRNLQIVEELTSRLSQAEVVGMMDQLAVPYGNQGGVKTLDACLASNIIEVGVDIDRLSLMGVIGQPKTTSTYIQVTGRVGRRWWERPGLVLMIYNPSKSRDRSHFEQFHSYHKRLYERVEPTTATPFAVSAIQRGLAGVLIAWARQHGNAPVKNKHDYMSALDEGYELIRARCESVQYAEDLDRSLEELARVRDDLERKWDQNPQAWEEYPPKVDGEYLMLWPGAFATKLQKQRGVMVPSSMRQVDNSAELTITQGYALALDDEV